LRSSTSPFRFGIWVEPLPNLYDYIIAQKLYFCQALCLPKGGFFGANRTPKKKSRKRENIIFYADKKKEKNEKEDKKNPA
jgi:hypothetical protein